MLIICPVFGHYLETVAKVKHGDVLKAAIDSYHACACCIALAKEGKQGVDGAAGLADAMLKHAEQKSVAYPNCRFRAKDHWRLHIGDQMARDGVVLDCFAGERVNRAFKRCAQEVCFTGSKTLGFEASVIKRIMIHFDMQLENMNWKDHLRSPAARSEALATIFGTQDCFVARSMVVDGLQLFESDIVLIDNSPCEVEGGASVAGAVALIVRELSFVRQETATANRWRRAPTDSAIAWASEHQFRYATAWYIDGDEFVILSI